MASITDANLKELHQLCGVEVDKQLRNGGEDGLTNATLRRWLIARKGDVKAAARDLRAHAAWRAAYVPNGIISAAEIQDEIAQNKAFFPGVDKAGRPFCIVVVSRHQMKDPEASKRYIAYSLDCASLMGSTRPEWDGKMSGLFDLRGLKASNCDLATLRNVFDLLQHHYPERLHTLWLFHAPMVFYGLYKLVYPFIDPVTREKVKFVYEKDAEAEFLAGFDANVLPPEICPGGTGVWITVQQRYEMLLKDLKGAGGVAAGDSAAAAATAAGGAKPAAAMATDSAADGVAASVAVPLAAAQQQQELQQEAPVEVGSRPVEVVA